MRLSSRLPPAFDPNALTAAQVQQYFLIGIGAFILMFALKKLAPKVPNVLVAVALTTVISWAIGFQHDTKADITSIHSDKTKELITFALVVLSRCGECVKFHRAKALAMGITEAQLEEAAWCAVAIGGAPVRMFYLEQMK